MRDPANCVAKAGLLVLLLGSSILAQEPDRITPSGRPVGPIVSPSPVSIPPENRVGFPPPQTEPRPSPSTTLPGPKPDLVVHNTSDPQPPPQPPPPPPTGCHHCIPPGSFALGVTTTFDLGATLPGAPAKATAQVLREADGTKISLSIRGLTEQAGPQYLYVIDHMGQASKVGTVRVEGGEAEVSATTPLDRFMLAVSSEDNLKVVGPSTKVSLITDVPDGFTFSQAAGARSPLLKARIASVASEGSDVQPHYDAPPLGIQTFALDTETKLQVAFSQTAGLSGEAFITRRSGGAGIKVAIRAPQDAPSGTRYVLWAITSGQTYTRLGQAVVTSQARDLVIEADTSLTDFGLLMTTETEMAPPLPSGPSIATFIK